VRVRVLSVLVTNWILQPQSWPVGSIDYRYLRRIRSPANLHCAAWTNILSFRNLEKVEHATSGRIAKTPPRRTPPHESRPPSEVKIVAEFPTPVSRCDADFDLQAFFFCPLPPPPRRCHRITDPIGAPLLHPIGAPLLTRLEPPCCTRLEPPCCTRLDSGASPGNVSSTRT
jgi:hypothetical protein